ncbi:hypothetical protein RB195_015693 [Necator americanus]|uniref:Uncharacterized protein n=1 Tax=Necator americanus TaxID=51031 RepID=A0ABR1E686_NECAM
MLSCRGWSLDLRHRLHVQWDIDELLKGNLRRRGILRKRKPEASSPSGQKEPKKTLGKLQLKRNGANQAHNFGQAGKRTTATGSRNRKECRRKKQERKIIRGANAGGVDSGFFASS